MKGPVLVHVVTEKGKVTHLGPSVEKYHAVPQFDVVTGEQIKPAKQYVPNYTSVFAQELIKLADDDPKIVAVTAAMPSGTELDKKVQKSSSDVFLMWVSQNNMLSLSLLVWQQRLKPFVFDIFTAWL